MCYCVEITPGQIHVRARGSVIDVRWSSSWGGIIWCWLSSACVAALAGRPVSSGRVRAWGCVIDVVRRSCPRAPRWLGSTTSTSYRCACARCTRVSCTGVRARVVRVSVVQVVCVRVVRASVVQVVCVRVVHVCVRALYACELRALYACELYRLCVCALYTCAYARCTRVS